MAFSNYRILTIDHTKCGSTDSANFPVLVSISSSTFKNAANGGPVQNSSGYDIIFTSDLEGTTKIPWEVEFYDGVNGILVAWVNIAVVSCTVDTLFYMSYGDVTITTAQNTGSYAPTAVWDANYKGVWHLPDGSSLTANDSTGVNNGTVNSATAATGKVGGGADFNGSASISVAANTSLDILTAETWSFWVKDSGNGDYLSKNDGNTVNAGWVIFRNSNFLTLLVERFNLNLITAGSFTMPNNTWTYVTVINDGTLTSANILLYENGVLDTHSSDQNGTGSHIEAATYPLYMGNNGGYGGGVGPLVGVMDEVRISDIARSADWILTEYNNQNAPGNIGTSGFLTFGAETSNGAIYAYTDTLSLSDAVGILNSLDISSSDSLSLSDVINILNSLNIPLTDTLSLSDAIDALNAYSNFSSDTLSLSDAVGTGALSSSDQFFDTLSLLDTIGILNVYLNQSSDILSLSDSQINNLGLLISGADSNIPTDLSVAIPSFSVKLSDLIAYSDDILTNISDPSQYLINISDSLSFIDILILNTIDQIIQNNVGTPIWTDQQLALWSADALADIAVNVPCIFARECLPITQGKSVYTLPNYVRTLRRVTWRGKSLEPASWEELQLLTPATVFLADGSSANIETSQSRPLFYALHPTNQYDIRLHPCPNESFTASGEPDPYSPIPNSPSCIIDYWREPDTTGANPLISLPPYIARRTQKAYVMSVAFAAEGKGQDGNASNYYDKKYQFLLSQFRAINEGCFISKKYSLGDGMLDPQNYRYPRPMLGPNFERTIF